MEAPRYVVRVSGKTHDGASLSGTGFLASEEGHVATCWHVVAQAAGINVQLPYTEPWLYRISAKVDSDDLALLALVAKASLPTPFAPLHGNWREDSQIGNSVTVWGCSTAQYYTAPRHIPCTIGSFSEQHGRIGLSGDINSGDSGAPVVNAAGKVIGMANARDRVRSMLVPLGKLCVILDDVWQVDPARLLTSAVPPGCQAARCGRRIWRRVWP